MDEIIATNRREGEGERAESQQAHQSRRQERSGPKILSREECLAKLSALPTLVAMGLLTTSKANCIRGTIATVLQFGSSKVTTDSSRDLDPNELASVLQANPELAKFLAPLLSTEEIEAILRGGTGDGVS